MRIDNGPKGIQTYRLIALAMVLMGLFLMLSVLPNSSGPAGSVEVRYADRSRSGLSIVPASCPSRPHWSGACDTPVTPTPGGFDPDSTNHSSQGGCSIASNPTTVEAGATTTLAWYIAPFNDGRIHNPSGTVTPGNYGVFVSGNGSRNVYPTQTTSYFLTGQYGASGYSFVCDATVIVTQEGGQCSPQYFCRGYNLLYQDSECGESFIERCAYGCVDAACLPTPSPSGVLQATPRLVQQGQEVQILWSTSNVDSCTVTGSNGDSWNTLHGPATSSPITGQTVYTISCGGQYGTFTDTEIVNVLPIFEEI